MANDLGPYKSIKERKDSLYALLVSAGYLKVASPLARGTCQVAIPNHEIAQVFVKLQGPRRCALSHYVIYYGEMRAMKNVMCAFLAAGAFGFADAAERLPDIFKKGEKILFIGDSITHGGRKGDMNHYLGHGFQAEIAMRYLAYRPELDLQFANRGISGDSSSNVVARWSTDAIPFTPNETGYDGPFPGSKGKPVVPDWMNLFVGANDDWKVKVVPFENYERNMRYMIDSALKANPKMKIVLCEEFRPLGPDGKERASANTLRRREVVRKLAKEYGLIHVPLNDFFQKTLMNEKPQMKWWIWDNCHPTYAGHMRLADFWLETVAKAVGEGK